MGEFNPYLYNKRRLCFMDFMNPIQSGSQNGGASCGCNRGACGSSCKEGWGLNGHPLAIVYAPCQVFEELYDLQTALKQGTLFKELDLPFEGAGTGACKGKGCCR